MTPSAERIYLHVVPEERAAAKAAGALWDDQLKCCYITAAMDAAAFAPWLEDNDLDDELEVVSPEAYVARAMTPCSNCHATIEIICIYCAIGIDLDEPLEQFTVSNIWAMDDALAQQLTPWPHFKKGLSPVRQSTYFANHCPHCSTLQEDLFLHDEPDGPFFSIPQTPPDGLQLHPLRGEIRLSGDCHFCI